MNGKIYVEDHLTLLHTKYLCSGLFDSRAKDVLHFLVLKFYVNK